MPAPSDVLLGTSRFTARPPSTPQGDLLRALFHVGMRKQSAQLAQHADTLAALDATCAADSTSRERALIALRMYCAREATEEIENALVCIGDGTSPARSYLPAAAAHVVVAALHGLAERGDVKAQVVDAALEHFDIDIEPPA